MEERQAEWTQFLCISLKGCIGYRDSKQNRNYTTVFLDPDQGSLAPTRESRSPLLFPFLRFMILQLIDVLKKQADKESMVSKYFLGILYTKPNVPFNFGEDGEYKSKRAINDS
uniref:Uncharacterized protein n=1 Tax=Romanomermis culicivorax TaxID=13658 RepID=A0A915IKU4_ROMCU